MAKKKRILKLCFLNFGRECDWVFGGWFRPAGVRSKTPPEGYSVFLCYASSMCKTAIEHHRVPFSKASQTGIFRREHEDFVRKFGLQGTLLHLISFVKKKVLGISQRFHVHCERDFSSNHRQENQTYLYSVNPVILELHFFLMLSKVLSYRP